jgi:hypothetical protein
VPYREIIFDCPHCLCPFRLSFLLGYWSRWKCYTCGKESFIHTTDDGHKVLKNRPTRKGAVVL